MTTAVSLQTEKKSSLKFFADRDDYLLSLILSLEAFSNNVSIRYDDRWRRHEWRVRGNENLQHWIYDHLQSLDEVMLSNEEVIERAYKHFQEIQARKGQLNFNSVYVEDCEKIIVVDSKKLEHAEVRVVQDCIDFNWRWSTGYWVGKGGSSSPLSYRFNIAETKTDAILSGANYMRNCILESWEYKEGSQTHKIFLNKIEIFINNLMGQNIQPSLFQLI